MSSINRKISVGDRVKILSIPDWLVAELPEDEKMGILECVGKELLINEIDQWGGMWVGFGSVIDGKDDATYAGQSFIVEPNRIELVSK